MAKDGFWERSGYFVGDVIADIEGVSAEIGTDVREILLDRYGLSYHALKDGEEEPYASDACYEECEVDDGTFQESWATFRDKIQSRVRFFNAYAEETLNHIFGDFAKQKAFYNKSLIREINPDDEDSQIWRARTAESTKKLKAILKAPARKIGPPPPRLAKRGRMNPAGIPVFYGATDRATCVAELRAPVGSHVVLGKFELLRTVKLLDFDALMGTYVDVSHFDPDYDIRHGRAAFLRSLISEICKPVVPQDEALEYLPSQVVAEYLANKLDQRLDGIIFPSSQTKGGNNVVLFNHACGVRPDDLPEGSEVTVHVSRSRIHYGDEDDVDDGDIQVLENVARKCTSSPNNDNATPYAIISSARDMGEINNEDEEPPTCSKPTLRLDAKNVFVLDIRSVCYEHSCREVFRYRHAKDES